MESRGEKMLAEGIEVMAAGVGQFKQDVLERLVGIERTVVIPRGPGRGGRFSAYEKRGIREV